ncbi:MAG: hypothetical protein JWO04_4366 [Gammaproteobacteria bacterium]|nr:hypothetical protein [Gammaproteobacteria bacterium]
MGRARLHSVAQGSGRHIGIDQCTSRRPDADQLVKLVQQVRRRAALVFDGRLCHAAVSLMHPGSHFGHLAAQLRWLQHFQLASEA